MQALKRKYDPLGSNPVDAPLYSQTEDEVDDAEWVALPEDERRRRLAEALEDYGVHRDPTTFEVTVRADRHVGDAIARVRALVEREVSSFSSPRDRAAVAEALRTLAKEVDEMVVDEARPDCLREDGGVEAADLAPAAEAAR